MTRTTRTTQQLFDLTGRTALVTGGSRGLGLQMAEALGECGATVVVSARKTPELEQAVAHLAARGITASFIAADASKDADMQRLADEALQRLGRIDILVNNAGASWGAPAEDHPVEAWDKVMNVNIRGIFLLTQLVGRKLARKVPLRRTGDDEDLKGLVALLASDAGKHITGQVIAVDGGTSMVISA